jgi:ATP-binding cassette subfamily C (CFTR/MRP) protein 1
MPVLSAIYSICLQGFFKRAVQAGMNVKTDVICVLYRKALKLSNAARKRSTVGEIVNLMAVDAQRILETTFVVDLLWSGPIIISLVMWALWQQIGKS